MGVIGEGGRPAEFIPVGLTETQAAADMLATFAAQAAIALELANHRRQAERMAGWRVPLIFG